MAREPRAFQDASDHLRIEDEGDQLAPGHTVVAAQDINSEDTLPQLRMKVAADGAVPSPIGVELTSLGPLAGNNVLPQRGPTGQDAVTDVSCAIAPIRDSTGHATEQCTNAKNSSDGAGLQPCSTALSCYLTVPRPEVPGRIR